MVPMKKLLLILVCIALAACTTPSVVTHPTASEVPSTNPPATLTSQAVSPVPSKSSSKYGGIVIRGNADFITQTVAALTLLEQKAPDAFQKIQTYVGIIEQGEHSGMWAWEVPPRYEVGDATAFFSVTWYASTIAHDATHSELYTQYELAHPGEPVPDNAYGGVEIERFCIGYQLEVAKRIGAPQSEIDYLASLDGTHCDLDNDGDCDWDDYQKRDW